MNSNTPSLTKKIVIGTTLLLGFVLVIRLGVIAYQSRRVGRPQTQEEIHAAIKKIADAEREQAEKNWNNAGLPAKDFDTSWKKSRGRSDSDDLNLPQAVETP